ncbi:hypothetical protein CPY51_18645 [Rhizobium tubonense]|uniref:Uncharacterized protein n=1 Tax=Rhizobium tubonense TaxID=484088 RepID=A0A2W4CG36_9HYPH|nr:hypothetical protein CPY51_18645 [Rhizobium tubonense]
MKELVVMSVLARFELDEDDVVSDWLAVMPLRMLVRDACDDDGRLEISPEPGIDELSSCDELSSGLVIKTWRAIWAAINRVFASAETMERPLVGDHDRPRKGQSRPHDCRNG